MRTIWSSLRLFIWMSVLTGVIYPLVITGIAHLAMKSKAQGSFIAFDGRFIGSSLIGQKFEEMQYFWSRPSAANYNPLPSQASNFGPTSAALKKAVDARRKALMRSHDITDKALIPSELVFASGSGLDPHISRRAAYFQIERIAKARNMDKNVLKELVDSMVEERYFGFIGEPCINVLLLNIRLQGI